jgi:clan AA aspartic protease
MGLVYADIELINGDDIALANNHIIGQEEIKSMHVNMLVDSGAFMMAINESIQAQLQLPVKQKRKAQLADGSITEYDVVGPIEVRFKNRQATCNAFVLKGDAEPLLGAIPMEEMDVLVHPTRQELLVNPEHPYYAVLKMK